MIETIYLITKGQFMNTIENVLSNIVYDNIEKHIGNHIDEFTVDDAKQLNFKFVDDIITTLIKMLNVTPIINPQTSNTGQGFIQVNKTGKFNNVKVITIQSMYSSLIANYPFWNIPGFGGLIQGLKRERTLLKQRIFKGENVNGKVLALKVFINMLYGYIMCPESKVQSLQGDNTWISRIGYNLMEHISKNPCVLYIDTDMIISTEVPIELQSISYLQFHEETRSVEILSKKRLYWIDDYDISEIENLHMQAATKYGW